MKCVFTCSIFVNSNTKIFECFRCFWKVFCSKNLKISKILFCLVLATQLQVSQIVGLSREFAGQFWRLVRKWKVQSRGLLRDFHGSSHDSLASRLSSREKHLEIFFQNFVFKCFGGLSWRLVGDSLLSQKTRVWQKSGQFLNLFQFSLKLLWLFIFFFNCLLPKHFVYPFSNSIVASFRLKIIKKRYGSCSPDLIFPT